MVTSGALLDGGAELLWTSRRLTGSSKRRVLLTKYIDAKREWIRRKRPIDPNAIRNPHERASDVSDAAWARQVLSFVRWHAARAKHEAQRELRADLLALCNAFEPLVQRAETLAAIGGGSTTTQDAPRAPRMNVRIADGARRVDDGVATVARPPK